MMIKKDGEEREKIFLEKVFGRKNILLMSAVLFSLLLVNNVFAVGGIHLTIYQDIYQMNEIVAITVNDDSGIVPSNQIAGFDLEIFNNESINNYYFKYLGLLENQIRFVPRYPGQYIVRLYSNDTIISEISFYVAESSGNCESILDEITIDVNKINNINGDLTINPQDPISIIYENPEEGISKKYYYSGSIDQQIIYTPKDSGIYSIYSGNTLIGCYEVQNVSGSSSGSSNVISSEIKNIKISDSRENPLNYNIDVLAEKKIPNSSIVSYEKIAPDTLLENNSYDIDFDFQEPVKSMRFKKLKYRSNINIGIDKIDRIKDVDDKRTSDVFAVNLYDLEFENASFQKIARGTELYKCRLWNFSFQRCDGYWEKLMDIIPGQEYSVDLYPGDPGFAEVGVASINTNKSIYHPNETAKMIIVVLDKHGFLADDASVMLNVTSPQNISAIYSTQSGTIMNEDRGIYVAYYNETSIEGNYTMFVAAAGYNVNDTMQSYFIVKSFYEFDILRNTPVTMDPWRSDFTSTIKIISYVGGNFNFTETLPDSFAVTDYGGATSTVGNGLIYLSWNSLASGDEIHYSALPPLITPELYEMQSYIEHSGGMFNEARPWYLAVDPSYFYDPNSTLLSGWISGTGTTYTEINDTIRYNNAPNTNNYLTSYPGESPAQFGFPNITQSGIDNITLWVYTGTGSNAQYTFELRQDSTTQCSDTRAPSSPTAWYNCTWNNPSGSLSNITLYLSTITKIGGGKNQPANVYAAYIEAFIGNLPPTVSLQNPANGTTINSTPIDFNFTAVDGESSVLANCSLWANFSGTFARVTTRYNVNNGSVANITYSPSDGSYIWNVRCIDVDKSSFAPSNYTLTINAQPPSITIPGLNTTLINQSETVRFNASITDSFGISYAYVQLRYPNSTLKNYTLNNSGNEYYYVFNETTQAGLYNITLVWANDTKGQISQNNSLKLTFNITTSPPGPFNLTSPANNTESSNLLPRFNWTQTAEPNFSNYTLMLDKDPDFGTPDFKYYTYNITNTSYLADFALDGNSIYYWQVIAYDAFGSSRNSTQKFTYITDNIPPTIILNTPGNNTYWTNPSITFNYSVNDTNTLSRCTLYANFSGTFSPNETNTTLFKAQPNYFTTAVSAQGIYLWNVWCNDSANNNKFYQYNYTLKLDLLGPNVYLMSPPNNTLENTTNLLTFEANATDILSNISSCSIIVDETVKDTKAGMGNGEKFNFTIFVDNGNSSWHVNCTDINGFTSSSFKYNISILVVDTDAPLVTLNYPAPDQALATNNISFNYTPEDATGIQNCSLYINGQLNKTNYSVENFVPNYFNATNLPQGGNNWTIECYDNSTEYNYYKATEKNFIIDLYPPNITLNMPLNDSFSNSSVKFNYTAVDSYLNSCALYGNFTGPWTADQYNNSVISGQYSYFTKTLSDGTYIWNIWCNDSASTTAFAQYNYTIKVDTTPPQYSSIIIQPASPRNFSPAGVYNFSIVWTDSYAVDMVLFENNFSGTLANTTLTGAGGTYNYSISAIVPGNYTYRWIANDSRNNKNQTPYYNYVVNRSATNITLYLNGTNGNITIIEGSSVNISATLSNPPAGYIELYREGVKINSGNAPLSNISSFPSPGSYNITAIYPLTQNYTYGFQTFYVNVMDNTLPVVSQIFPENNTQTGSGLIQFQYNVTDKSSIINCSIYVNGALSQTNYSIARNITQYFYVDLSQGDYNWSVACFDSYDNPGNSYVYNFSAIDTTAIKVNVTPAKNQFEKGEYANINTYTTTIFDNPLATNVSTYIIRGNTTLFWWDTAWKKRKPIYLNETLGQSLPNGIVYMNITGLNSSISNCNELRIIRNTTSAVEIPLKVYSGDNSTWCYIVFRANVSANAVNNNDYYVYYNNSAAADPGYTIDFEPSYSYFAQQSAADEGTPSNVANIIGSNDTSFATMTVSGGGAQASSAHGRSFIPSIPAQKIFSAQVRYRYEVPVMTASWQLRYSLDDGAGYSNAYVGTTTVPKTTSGWVDLTTLYPVLNWSSLNNTRLQGRVEKPGGGSSATMYLYWVEMNVTVRLDSTINQTSLGASQDIISYSSGETDMAGDYIHGFETVSLTFGNYSAVSRAIRENYTNSTGYKSFEIVPDATPPNITLLVPEDLEERGVGFVNFSYLPYDINLYNCTLYTDVSGSFSVNQTHPSPTNNATNIFDPIYFGAGLYKWNVLCADTYNNSGFASTNFTLNITGPDLTLNSTDIYYGNISLVEGSNITLFANITNAGFTDANESFIVQFFKGDPDVDGVQINGNQTIDYLNFSDSIEVNVSYVLGYGFNTIFVKIDPDNAINESDENNNKANMTITVSIYHYYYGNVTANFILGTSSNDTVVKLTQSNVTSGNVLIADSDSLFYFNNLQALGRNINNDSVNNDFTELDILLNTSAFNDSVNFIWTNNTDIPLYSENFNLSSRIVSNVPIINSTNASFITGILWDMDDDGSNLQYDSSDKEDIVFVAKVLPLTQGGFGEYSYEVRIPAKLRDYRGATSTVSFYYEID